MKDVIEMAREAGATQVEYGPGFVEYLERFADIVRADQRAIDAKIADDLTKHSFLGRVGEAIRARGNT
jgi:hypothetical protein